MQKQEILRALFALGALVISGGANSQDIRGVAQQFLQRLSVPCLSVLKVDHTDNLGEVATCQDGREWILLWVEGEIAFVHPWTREAYKWDREVYMSHSEIYLAPKQATPNKTQKGDAHHGGMPGGREASPVATSQ
jgi:hypothetical protein